jgi:hypothetical protein
MAHLRHLSDITELAGRRNSQLEMRLGQRFESARRLSFFPFFLQNSQKDTIPQWDDRRLGSSRAAVDYPKFSSRVLACYKWLQGRAGGVGESSGIDCLTDVPEFGSVRHHRKSFAWVPRS